MIVDYAWIIVDYVWIIVDYAWIIVDLIMQHDFSDNPTVFSLWEATPFVIHRKGVQKRRPSGLPRSGLISNVRPFTFSFHRVDRLAHISRISGNVISIICMYTYIYEQADLHGEGKK